MEKTRFEWILVNDTITSSLESLFQKYKETYKEDDISYERFKSITYGIRYRMILQDPMQIHQSYIFNTNNK